MRFRTRAWMTIVGALFALPSFAQDSNTASKARGRVNAAAAQEGARASEAGDIDEGDEGAAEEGAATEEAPADEAPAADEGAPAATEGGEPAPNAPESYTVQPGDTLWGLSQRFLNNPWYWPKVWSYNPGLDNPNWIRPGSTIRFYPGGGAPVVEDSDQPEPEEDTEFVDIPLFEGDKVKDALERMSGMQASGFRREFFVPADKVDDAGRILNSPQDKVMLSEFDGAYVKLTKGGAGDVFQIFRAERDVNHPVTGAYLGKVVTVRGEMRIDTVSKDQSLAHVTKAWDDVGRGDYLAVLKTFPDDAIIEEANTSNVKGYLVDHAPTSLSLVGSQYIVILDKGQGDGVKPGNIFTVVRAGDPYTRQYTGLVDEDIGRIMVLETFDKTSKGVILDSALELVPGDRIEMRTK